MDIIFIDWEMCAVIREKCGDIYVWRVGLMWGIKNVGRNTAKPPGEYRMPEGTLVLDIALYRVMLFVEFKRGNVLSTFKVPVRPGRLKVRTWLFQGQNDGFKSLSGQLLCDRSDHICVSFLI